MTNFKQYFTENSYFEEPDENAAPIQWYFYAYKLKDSHMKLTNAKKVMQHILLDPQSAFYYARNILEKRWSELEKRLLDNDEINLAIDYAQDVMNARWPALEKRILDNEMFNCAVKYAQNVIGRRWPEAEERFNHIPGFVVNYVRQIVGQRYPEGEQTLVNFERENPETGNTMILLYVATVEQNRVAQDKKEILELISDHPEWIKHVSKPDYETQKIAIEKLGRQALPLIGIDKVDKRLLDEFPAIANLKRSGMFR